MFQKTTRPVDSFCRCTRKRPATIISLSYLISFFFLKKKRGIGNFIPILTVVEGELLRRVLVHHEGKDLLAEILFAVAAVLTAIDEDVEPPEETGRQHLCME